MIPNGRQMPSISCVRTRKRSHKIAIHRADLKRSSTSLSSPRSYFPLPASLSLPFLGSYTSTFDDPLDLTSSPPNPLLVGDLPHKIWSSPLRSMPHTSAPCVHFQ